MVRIYDGTYKAKRRGIAFDTVDSNIQQHYRSALSTLKQSRSRCNPAINVDGGWSHDTSSAVLVVGGSNRRSR